MKHFYKYLFFLVLGIITFILLNGVDSFSVGVPSLQDIVDRIRTTCASMFNREEIEDEFNIVEFCDGNYEGESEGGAVDVSVEAESGKIKYNYNNTNHTLEVGTGSTEADNLVELTDKEYAAIIKLFVGLNDGEKDQVIDILRSLNDQNFLNDLKMIDSMDTNIDFRSIYLFYTNNSVTLDSVRNTHIAIGLIDFESIIGTNSVYKLYQFEVEKDTEVEFLNALLRESGNTSTIPSFDEIDNDDLLFFLTEIKDVLIPGQQSIQKEFVRSIAIINIERRYVRSYSVFPVGRDYGIKLFELLYKNKERFDITYIEDFGSWSEDDDGVNSFPIPDIFNAFRRLYHKSVTPGKGFLDSGDIPTYSIFMPTGEELSEVYTKKIFCIFMSLDELSEYDDSGKYLRLLLLDDQEINQLINDNLPNYGRIKSRLEDMYRGNEHIIQLD